MTAHALPLAANFGAADLETLFALGKGGMATAFLARALGPGGFERLVVLKRLNLELIGRGEHLERFLAEARVAARLHHSNIVGTHHVGRDAAGPFIVLDYVEGGSLDDLVDRSNDRKVRLPVPVVLRIALDSLAGLDAVHEARDTDGRKLAILHRDVTLQNLLVGVRDGVTRVADFGVAKSTLGAVHTAHGCFVGKLYYFAPEYLRREPIGPALDIYALGICLWSALTGSEPWPDESEAQIVRAITEEGVPPLEEHVTVAPAVRSLVMRACARDPKVRFQSAREMANAIERLDRDCGWVATHAAVAEVVADLLGPELERRRTMLHELTRPAAAEQLPFAATSVFVGPSATPKVAESTRRLRIDEPPRSTLVSPSPPVAPPPPGPAGAAARPGAPVLRLRSLLEHSRSLLKDRRTRRRLELTLAGVTAGGIALAFVLRSGSSRDDDVPLTPRAISTAKASAPLAAADPTTPRSVDPSSSTAPATDLAPVSSSVTAAPPPVATASSSAKPAPVPPSPSKPAPVRVADPLRRRNPYR